MFDCFNPLRAGRDMQWISHVEHQKLFKNREKCFKKTSLNVQVFFLFFFFKGMSRIGCTRCSNSDWYLHARIAND